LSVGKSVGNKKILLQIDLLTELTRKKKLPASFRRYIPQKIPSLISSVIYVENISTNKIPQKFTNKNILNCSQWI